MSWSSSLLKSGTVCSRTLLMQPSATGESNWEHACMQMGNILDIYCERVSLTKVMDKWNTSNSKTCSFTAELVIFLGLKVSQSKVHTINRWGGTSNLSMEYLLSSICTKNYWNRTTLVEISWNYRWWLGGILYLRHSVVLLKYFWRFDKRAAVVMCCGIVGGSHGRVEAPAHGASGTWWIGALGLGILY